jgi:uncharacterized Zn finger protein
MKCKQCGAEMTECMRTKYDDLLIVYRRCETCGYEAPPEYFGEERKKTKDKES